jgi:hypothetical protein
MHAATRLRESSVDVTTWGNTSPIFFAFTYYVPVSLVNPNPIHVENEDLLNFPWPVLHAGKQTTETGAKKQKDQHTRNFLLLVNSLEWGKNKLKSRFFSYFNRKRWHTHTHTHTGAQTLE